MKKIISFFVAFTFVLTIFAAPGFAAEREGQSSDGSQTIDPVQVISSLPVTDYVLEKESGQSVDQLIRELERAGQDGLTEAELKRVLVSETALNETGYDTIRSMAFNSAESVASFSAPDIGLGGGSGGGGSEAAN